MVDQGAPCKAVCTPGCLPALAVSYQTSLTCSFHLEKDFFFLFEKVSAMYLVFNGWTMSTWLGVISLPLLKNLSCLVSGHLLRVIVRFPGSGVNKKPFDAVKSINFLMRSMLSKQQTLDLGGHLDFCVFVDFLRHLN